MTDKVETVETVEVVLTSGKFRMGKKCFKEGDKLTVTKTQYKAFKDQMQLVANAVAESEAVPAKNNTKVPEAAKAAAATSVPEKPSEPELPLNEGDEGKEVDLSDVKESDKESEGTEDGNKDADAPETSSKPSDTEPKKGLLGTGIGAKK